MTARIPRFEDLSIGMEFAEHSQIVTIPINFRWCAVTEENRRDHYDEKYTMEQEKIPGAVFSGSHCAAYIYQLLFSLAGPDGWVYRVINKQNAMVHPGAVITFFAVVTNTYEKNGLGYVKVTRDFASRTVPSPYPPPPRWCCRWQARGRCLTRSSWRASHSSRACCAHTYPM